MPAGFVPFSERMLSAMLSPNNLPRVSVDVRAPDVLAEWRQQEIHLIPNRETANCGFRSLPCTIITFVALTTLFCVYIDQVNRSDNSEYQVFDAERTVLGNNTAAIAAFTDAYNAKKGPFVRNFLPILGTGILNMCFTPMYISCLGGDTGDPINSTTLRVARVGVTLLGAGTIVAGGLTMAAGFVGGPVIIAIGACSVITGILPPKNCLRIRQKIDAAVCSMWSRFSSCFRD